MKGKQQKKAYEERLKLFEANEDSIVKVLCGNINVEITN